MKKKSISENEVGNGSPVMLRFAGGLLALCLLLGAEIPLFAAVSEDVLPLETQVLSAEPEAPVSQDRLAQIEQELTVTTREMESALNEQERELLNQKAQSLRSLRSMIQRHGTLKEKYETLQEQLGNARSTASSLYVLEGEPPYSLSVYDKFLDDLEVLNEQLLSLKASRLAGQKELVMVRERLKGVQERARSLKEEVSEYDSKEETVPRELRLEYERVLLWEEQLLLSEQYELLQEETYKAEEEFLQLKKTVVTDLLAKIKENLGYTEENVQARMKGLDDQIAQLEQQLQKIAAEREKVSLALSRAEGRLNAAEEEEKRVVAASEVAELQAWKDYYQNQMEQKELLQQYLELSKEMWQYRYSLIGDSPGTLENMKEIKKRAEIYVEDLARLSKRSQSRQLAIQSRIGAVQKKLDDTSRPYAELEDGQLQGELEALQELARETLLFASSVSQISLLAQRLNRELGEAIGSFEITEHVTAIGKKTFQDIWNMEVWVIEDNQIVVGELIIALGLLVGGFILIRLLSAWISRRFQKRFNMTAEAASLIQRVFFYIFFFLTILWVLKIVNIPLTAFAFLGGALAIAVGFGAQHLFSNFISGFFLIIQKPIKVGDIVELDDGTVALVKEIGTRHTRIQNFDGIDILLPNSYLLENKITNWTYADRKLRNKLSVGVSYSSDPKKVENLLLQAAREHGSVLTNPFPFVIFKEFADSSLNFDMYFWVDMRFASGLTVGSELRYKVVELFREHNVEIPFPQMDVHFKREVSEKDKTPEILRAPEETEDASEGVFLEDDIDPTEGIVRG
ncbi:MAG TPA: mechanosensitive ion channel [Synergistaceae bacterium]|nr:mechanosensitive ion channel [Synergistaceae bacterium]HPQ36793.1 mechanosensitive ion channel [Synergistaceae bacterium]